MRSALRAALVGAAVLIAGDVYAQAFPAKTVRFVIPFPVGGSSDANARIIIPPLTERWKQQILVEPRPGAGTVVGTDYVAKSAPDGHTLLLTSNQYGYTPSVYAKLPYDPFNDIVPITIVTISPQAIVVHPSLPVRNTRELIALARARPGQLNMGTAGSVLPVHFFNMLAKTNIQVVPYKGAGPLMTDAMGGHVPLALAAISSVQGAVRSGRVKILVVCSSTPSLLFPDAPLIGKDLPGYDVNAWFGLMAPKGFPQELARRVRDDVAAVIQMPDVRQRLLEIGGEPSGITPDEFSARVRSEIAMWKKVAAEAGLKPE
ncbi:MAG TPA: tripartite tricarboxylate transporter substrate-binding protein [Burkholderiales bacterium]|nr:tripartite tricarboxylate transporter substrate-binding protein [Burkholderiales bacterium]